MCVWKGQKPLKLLKKKKRKKKEQSPLLIKPERRASLVAQWLRIRLPIQGTRVRALVREDPTCHRATKPVRHNYWACTPESTSHNYRVRKPQLLSPRATTTEAHTPRASTESASYNSWARVPQLLKPTRLEPVLCMQQEKPLQWEARGLQPRVAPAHRNEEARAQQRRPNAAKNK